MSSFNALTEEEYGTAKAVYNGEALGCKIVIKNN